MILKIKTGIEENTYKFNCCNRITRVNPENWNKIYRRLFSFSLLLFIKMGKSIVKPSLLLLKKGQFIKTKIITYFLKFSINRNL
jgi:hypothetical protein